MNYAHKAAQYAQFATKIKGARIGAIAVRGQNVFPAWNSRTTHPKQAHFARNPFCIHLHAEIAAMVRAKWDADALYVVRIGAAGEFRNAKPCEGCMRALTNVRKICYSTGIGQEIAEA